MAENRGCFGRMARRETGVFSAARVLPVCRMRCGESSGGCGESGGECGESGGECGPALRRLRAGADGYSDSSRAFRTSTVGTTARAPAASSSPGAA